jgi:hypothetical protein
MAVNPPFGRIGILSRGDRRAPSPIRENNRLIRVFDALEPCQVTAVPAVTRMLASKNTRCR